MRRRKAGHSWRVMRARSRPNATTRPRAFTRDQKVALLKALMSVFVSDGKFEESEHAALLDYTAAIGFDREGAPQLLRSFTRGSIT